MKRIIYEEADEMFKVKRSDLLNQIKNARESYYTGQMEKPLLKRTVKDLKAELDQITRLEQKSDGCSLDSIDQRRINDMCSSFGQPIVDKKEEPFCGIH